ncbi:MAG: hypothetical protein FE045_00875 [Thermoplasmata archaeon]|jgi:hypothetical protein|nr:MAG: hypothetical protein FE045_00875 [Thermoplasmata archaeon]MCD6222397.1 hypothetical protein [Thermoplasmata archaeon]
MKKTVVIVAILIIAPFITSINATFSENGKITQSHTVMAELGAVSWCPHCPAGSEKMYSLFNSGKHDFYYVTLVYDKNPLAQDRGKWLNDVYIPMLYVDGGYRVADNSNEDNFENAISAAEGRATHPVSVEVSAKWVGENEIEVGVNVTNEGSKPYIGHLRVYVAEITSRWNDEAGLPFHYAFLDFAINNYVIVMPHKTTHAAATWNAAHASKGLDFSGIQQGNIMVVASIAHWMPHLGKNPWEQPVWSTVFPAQFVDDADGVAI